MATQGIVTVRKGGRVIVKVIAGCDGYNARKLARRLRRMTSFTAEEVYDTARAAGFGSNCCRVVMTPHATRFEGGGRLHPRYRKTFTRAHFNPRWKHGTADHVVVVDV